MSNSLPLHGGQLQAIAERFGIPPSRLTDFSANINPDGPPPGVLSSLRAGLDNISLLTTYPDLEHRDLKQSIAEYTNIPVDSIVVANGFVPLLEAVLRTLSIRTCLLPVPAFVEYQKVLERFQVAVTPMPLDAEADFRYEIDRALFDRQEAILLANPQNPSGVLTSREVMLQHLQEASRNGTYVFLDEAFIDYVPEQTLASYVDHYPNLIVFRSVTKFFGIPGLRAAYAITNKDLAARLNQIVPPWPITTLAAHAIEAALADVDYINRSRSLNLERRQELQTRLESLGLYVYPSAANFLLFRFPSDANAIDIWQRMIVEGHIVTRNCANYETLDHRYLRVAVMKPSENALLVEGLHKVLSSC